MVQPLPLSNSRTFLSPPIPSLPSPWQPLIYFLFLGIWLFGYFHVNGIIWCVTKNFVAAFFHLACFQGSCVLWMFKYFIPFYCWMIPYCLDILLLLLLLLLLLSRFSRVRLCVNLETAAHQAPLSLGFSRQEHWSGLPFPSPMHESEKWKWSCSVVSDSYRPHGLQPTRLLHPWDSPGKSTGVGCHCLLLQLVYSFFDQLMDMNCFYFLAIMNNAAVKVVSAYGFIFFLKYILRQKGRREYIVKIPFPCLFQTPIPLSPSGTNDTGVLCFLRYWAYETQTAMYMFSF